MIFTLLYLASHRSLQLLLMGKLWLLPRHIDTLSQVELHTPTLPSDRPVFVSLTTDLGGAADVKIEYKCQDATRALSTSRKQMMVLLNKQHLQKKKKCL